MVVRLAESSTSNLTPEENQGLDGGFGDGGTGMEISDNAQPRYQQVARQLTAAIADGRFPIGSQLPTEMEICKQLSLSRFTVREAIRVLVDRGLVVRRPRVGTIVIATPDESRYTVNLSSIKDLFQYAQHTDLVLSNIRQEYVDTDLALELGLPTDESWICATGLRSDTETSSPFCVTHLYVNPRLSGIEKRLRKRKTAVYSLLEKEYGVRIKRVEQELQGVIFNQGDAALLGLDGCHAGLRIIRRYFDGSGRLLEVADNIHRSDRFNYRMHLSR
ncbi:GntR family transcriptional regulator [Castellaniella sp.]|uniref:GntR family transcriptional regulator n=1 Tax=Castellaniella sp. TaxID=1955812 RepID=UPI0035685D50